MKAVVLQPVPPAPPGKIHYPLKLTNLPVPAPSQDEVLVRLLTAALNHRDVFQRRALYPGTAPSIPLLADGYGTVLTPSSPLHNKHVLIYPAQGWESSPRGPESGALAILGGTKHYPNGTLQEFGVFPAAAVVEAPAHLSDEEAAALPLCGLTAWRAVVSKAQVRRGDAVLITGIGGGVALMALQFCVALGARVWVTSSSEEKLRKATEMGAAGGVLYTGEAWDKELLEKVGGPLDAVVDGAGGDIVARVSRRLLRDGGKIVSYGMTLGPTMGFTMGAVLRNIEILGSTMGSRKEFLEMAEFVSKEKIRPVVSRVVVGMNVEDLEGLWEDMEKGRQFGKLVVRIAEKCEGRVGQRGNL